MANELNFDLNSLQINGTTILFLFSNIYALVVIALNSVNFTKPVQSLTAIKS